MSSIVKKLIDRGLIKNFPPHIKSIHYEIITGSYSYGVSSDMSDTDICAVCIPKKKIVFPHLSGVVPGFGKQGERFDSFQKHHILDPEQDRKYDVNVYNIVKYFQLCMDNNPNMVDSLFVPQRCVVHSTKIGGMLRDNRKLFLCKKAWHTFKGYAYAQLHKMEIKVPEGNRKDLVDEFGYDVKFAYHIVRLVGEVEQILSEGDLDLERDRERLKAIRRGEWAEEQVREFFFQKEKSLESLYASSTLPHTPREEEIKQLLLDCLEEEYGSLDGCVEVSKEVDPSFLKELRDLLKKYSI